MEHKIGEVITLPYGRKVEVVEGDGCKDCVFSDLLCGSFEGIVGSCGDNNRSDHKNIIFKEIKKE